jgi:hypothetical protein
LTNAANLIVLNQVFNAAKTGVMLVNTGTDGVSVIKIVFGLADGTLELIFKLLRVLLLDLRGK